MIKFFRKIRQNLLSEGKTGKYFKYAIGEIILVVIGILIALQINYLNQKKIDKDSEKQLYLEILANLQKDSIAITKTIELHQEGIKNQEYFIKTSFSEVIRNHDRSTLQLMVLNTRNGVLSFFPQYGVFNSIVANNDITLINSLDIKSKLIELYDYKYKRYENADIVMENYYQYDVSKFFSSKFKLVAPYAYKSEALKEMELDLMESNYEEFRELLGFIYPHSFAVESFLIEIQASINELINLLKERIDSN